MASTIQPMKAIATLALVLLYASCAAASRSALVAKKAPPPPPAKPAPKTLAAIAWGIQSAPFAVVNARCGDTLPFVWTQGFHNLIQTASATCTSTGTTVSDFKSSPASAQVALKTAGTTYYQCSVGNHCASSNMNIKVVTTC